MPRDDDRDPGVLWTCRACGAASWVPRARGFDLRCPCGVTEQDEDPYGEPWLVRVPDRPYLAYLAKANQASREDRAAYLTYAERFPLVDDPRR